MVRSRKVTEEQAVEPETPRTVEPATYTARVSWRPWGAWGIKTGADGSASRYIVPGDVDYDVISITGDAVTLQDPGGPSKLIISKGMLHLTRRN